MLTLLFTLFLVAGTIRAETASLAWWLLPDISNELPHELEEDETGHWVELWVRPSGEVESAPTVVMEQAPGARWVGMDPDKAGRPTKAYLVLGDRRVVEFAGETAKLGSLDGDTVTWADGSKVSLVEFKKKKKRRRSRGTSTRIKFGKVLLPSIAAKEQELPLWTAEGLTGFLNKIQGFPDVRITGRDLSAVHQLNDFDSSALGFRYAENCDQEERKKIEDMLLNWVEPRLTCWMKQNKELSSRLLAVLLQKPMVECRVRSPMGADHCGMASLPLKGEFFAKRPRINLAMDRCRTGLGNTLLHETFHLAGMRDGTPEMDKAFETAESCGAVPAKLSFANEGGSFLNDFQVETRMFLFRKVREEAVEKWGWSEGEKSFFLGVVCEKMGDKYCSRNYFQKAANLHLPGAVELPEGGEVVWATLAQFNFYDSIPEDLQRMRELARYLQRDPNGALLRRLETGTHRLHEFFVARTTLQAVQENKGICDGETDERVLCEDLATISKSPWFKSPGGRR